MVAPYYFKRDRRDNRLKDQSQEKLLKAKEGLAEESKTCPCIPAFLGNIYNGLKSILFHKDNVLRDGL